MPEAKQYVIADINLNNSQVEINKREASSDFSSLASYEVILESMWQDKKSSTPLLAISTGPLTGTGAPGTAVCFANYVSPWNGKVSMQLCEGALGPNLRYAGIDHLILHGQAEKPITLVISEEGIELKPAQEIQDLNIIETTNVLRQQVGDKAVIACVGSNHVASSPWASVVCDYYNEMEAPGLGRVFYDLGVKALVINGKSGIALAAPEKFLQEIIGIYQHCKDFSTPNTKMGAIIRSSYLSPWHKNTFLELSAADGLVMDAEFSSPLDKAQLLSITKEALRQGISRQFLIDFIASTGFDGSDGPGDLESLLNEMENWNPTIEKVLPNVIQATGLNWKANFPLPEAIDYAARLLKYYSGKEWNSFRLEETGRKIESIYGEMVRRWENG